MPKAKGQEDKRRPDFFIDRHGREYFANIEIESGDPLDLTPYNWAAPVSPPWARALLNPPLDDRDVVTIVPRMQRARKGYQVEIDYDRWEQKIVERNAQRMEQLRTVVQNMPNVNVPEVLKNPPKELLEYIGPEAFPPVEFIRAMRAGNKWALGLSSEIPPTALALLERIKPTVLAAKLVKSVDENDGGEPVDPFASDLSLERLMDLEETHDPESTGGKTVPVEDRRRRAQLT